MIFISAMPPPSGSRGKCPSGRTTLLAALRRQTGCVKTFGPFGATSLFFKALKAYCPFGDNERHTVARRLLRYAEQACFVKLKVKSLLVALRKTSQDFKSLKAKGLGLQAWVLKAFRSNKPFR